MGTPPNAHRHDPAGIHASIVHKGLEKELGALLKSFHHVDNFESSSEKKSIVVDISGTFEGPGQRRVAINFNNAAANVAYYNFSHGYDDEKAKKTQITVDIADCPVDEAVKGIVKELGKMELIGYPIRAREAASAAAAAQNAALSGPGGPRAWS